MSDLGQSERSVVMVTASVHDGAAPAYSDASARSLRSWLTGEDDLRGRLRFVESPPGSGELGGWVEALTVLLAPGGAAAALAGGLVSWARWHRSDLRLTLSRKDDERVEINVKRLRGLDADSLPEVIGALRGWLDGEDPPDGDSLRCRPADDVQPDESDDHTS